MTSRSPDISDHDHFMALAVPLAERVGWQGVETVSATALRLSGDHLPAYVGLMQLSAGLLDSLLASTDRRTALNVFARTADMAERHPAPAVYFLQSSPDLFASMGPQGALSMADIIDRTIASKWQDAAWIAQQSADICRRLRQAADRGTGIAFLSVLRRIALDGKAPVLKLIENGPALLKDLLDRQENGQVSALLDLLGRVAERHPAIAGHMLRLSRELMQRFSIDALEHLAEVVLSASRTNPDTAVALLSAAPGLVDRLPGENARAVLFDIYAMAVRSIPESPQLARLLCEQSPGVTNRIGLAGLQMVVGLCRGLGRKAWPPAHALWEVSGDLIDRIGMQGLEKVARVGRTISRVCPQTAAGFIQKSPGIIDRVGLRGLWAFAVFCRHMAEAGAGGIAVRFPEQSLPLMDRLLSRGERRLVRTTYRLADRLGRHNPMIAHRMLDKSPELIDRIGMAGLEAFCTLALEAARTSWTAADGLIKAAAEVIDRIGYRGLTALSAFSLRIAGRNVYGALSLLEKSPYISGRLVEIGGPALAVDVFNLAARAAESDWAVAVRLLENSIAVIACADFDAFALVVDRCMRMAAQGSAPAVALVEAAAAILEKGDMHTFSQVADLWLLVGPHCGHDAAARINACPDRIEALAAHGGPTLPDRVLQLLTDLSQHNGKAGLNLLNRCDTYVAAVGFEGLQRIAAQTILLTRLDPENAARFAAGESVGFADFMESIPKGLALEKVKPILFNYLAALLGYRLEIEAGERPSLAAAKIVLPAKVREFADDEHNFIYYKVMATHLEAHLEYGSFDLDIRKAHALIQSIQHRYGAGQVRDGRLDDFYGLFPEPVMIEDLVNIFEDYRIEQRLKREYPVLGKQIAMVNRHDLEKRRALDRIKNRKQKAVEAIVQALMAEHAPDSGPTQRQDDFAARALERGSALQGASNAFQDTLAVAAAFYFLISDRFEEPYRPLESPRSRTNQEQINSLIGNFGKASRSILERLQSHEGRPQAVPGAVETRDRSPRESPMPAGRTPRQEQVPHARRGAQGERRDLPAGADPEDDRTAPRGADQRDTSGSSSGMKFSSPERIEKLLRRLFKQKGVTPNAMEHETRRLRPEQIELLLQNMESAVHMQGGLESEQGTRLYCEWDAGQNRYRENWCRIREQVLPEESRGFYLDTIVKHAGLLRRVRREFQMMRPEEWSRLSRQPDGDEIDLDATVEYIVDRRVGLSPSENNYRRTQRNLRDIAVAVLVDMSKSTKGSTLRFEKEALIILAEALKEIGDAFALFGFSGDNRDNVDFFRIKDFEEPFVQQVQKRISGIEFGLENRDGTALRHTIGLLKKREERTRMIILISDGKPVDKEYSGRYAIEDTRKALVEAQKAGIKTFCITVDEKAADYLPRMYSRSSWVVIDDVSRLPEKITRIFARLTGR